MKARSCPYVSKDGYCKQWFWTRKPLNITVREDVVKGRKIYRVNVWKHPLICTACTHYEMLTAEGA